MYEHNALGNRSSLALCLTKVKSSRACCPATALIIHIRCIFGVAFIRGCVRDDYFSLLSFALYIILHHWP